MAALNWVWPPLMLALTTWRVVQLRRSVTGKARWRARITGPVAESTRVCAYDRAGQGPSGPASSPRDGVQSAEELHTLLAAAGEDGRPYVLVGHSTGGAYAMNYAARYPEQVAGLVLPDSSSPEQFTAMPAFEGQYAVMRRAYALLPTLSRLGLGRLVPATSQLPAADAAMVEAITSTSQGYRNRRDEVSVLPDLFTQAQALTTHVHRTVESTHIGLLEDGGPAAESVRAITEVVSSVRSAVPLPTT